MSDTAVGSPAPSEAVVNAPAPASAVAAVVGLAPSGPRSPEAEAQSPGVAGDPPPEGFVAGEGFWQGWDIPKDDAAAYGYIGEIFQKVGVRQSSGEAAADWLEASIGAGTLPPLEGSHSYDLSAYRNDFTAEDQPILQHFLRTMAAANATQQEVAVCLNIYLDGQKRIAAKQTARAAGGPAKDAPKPGNQLGLEEIRHIMKTDRSRYTKDEGMQQRYRDLLRANGA
jgi:hypothetical protein